MLRYLAPLGPLCHNVDFAQLEYRIKKQQVELILWDAILASSSTSTCCCCCY